MSATVGTATGSTVVVAGGSGLIGRPLVRHLVRRGLTVRQLVRRTPTDAAEIAWDPGRGRLDPRALDGVAAVVNLGGAGIGNRPWTEAYKREILHSRVDGTALLARTAAQAERPPGRILQASGIGYYGDRGDTVLDESAGQGSGFLADVVRQWEEAMDPAREAGLSVVHLRTAVVLAPSGGAMSRLLPLFRLGLGGRFGPGTQWWPWISLVDEVRAILHLLDSSLTGPVNVAGAVPATNAELTEALAEELHRPAVLHVPAFALRLALRELSGELLASTRAVPKALVEDGFRHRHPTVRDAVRWLVS